MGDNDNSFASNAVPEIQNKAPKPAGILPKNAQTWAILGIAVLMILVVAFSNSGAPRPKPRTAAGEQNAATPTQRRIDEYRAMVDEEARRLGMERQRAEQAKAQAQAAAAALPAQPQPMNPIYVSSQQPSHVVPSVSPEEGQRAALEAEKRKREYASLFSSNVALTYRKDQPPAQTQTPETPATPGGPLASLQAMQDQLNAWRQWAQVSEVQRPQVNPQQLTGAPATASTGLDRQQDRGREEASLAEKRKQQAEDSQLRQAHGKKYRLFEGTVIETVLTNRLDGTFSGPVNVMVTSNVYSHDHQQVLIPQGSRVLGEVQKVSTFGQQRLAVFFHRLIMPDGYSISLEQFQGLNQIGETGLQDKVNRHYMQIFGVSLAIGAIAGLAQANTRYGFDMTGLDAYRQGVATSLSQSGLRILDRYLNILPTFTVREGHRIKVYLTGDILLPAYDQHRMPRDV